MYFNTGTARGHEEGWLKKWLVKTISLLGRGQWHHMTLSFTVDPSRTWYAKYSVMKRFVSL